jgi:DNA-directed RNA polymerase subunit M/transcription elongation factor TFIIS
MQCVVLQPKGTTRNTSLPVSVSEFPTGKDIGTLLRRATAAEKVGEWKWGTTILHLFGYKTGKAGTETKHELPAPHDELVLYGEAVIVATTGGTLTSFTTSQYTTFYNEATGGVSDSDTESESDLESVESEVAEEEGSGSESEAESEAPIEEEEEDVPPPPPKVTRVKRVNRKVPTWMSLPDLIAESYDDAEPTHPTRIATLHRFQHFLGFFARAEHVQLEKGLLNMSLEEANRRRIRAVWENPEFQALYDIQCRRVLSNLAPCYVQNGRLLERYKEGEFAIHQIPYMSYSDLYPEKWVELADREMKREAKMLEVDTSMATDMYRCSRCGKRQCTYYEQQTRSADEPMTLFIRCVNCGKQWRQ